MKRVLIVEDAPEFQDALADLLKKMAQPWEIFGFLDGQSTLEFINDCDAPLDLVLVDLGLPDMSGVELISRIYQAWPEVPIVVISVFTNSEKVLTAIRAGAIGYLVKSDPDAIVKGIEQVLAGEFPISPLVARHLIEIVNQSSAQAQSPRTDSPLSPQENRLLEHIARGLSYAEAAQAMNLTVSTIQTYSRNLFRKLDVHSKTQAIVKARHAGFLS
ncbi:MAG: response regulator transcription factor [Wenzhouxiangella sp.]|nr:response regulator transcription factor [Wenzhouxiangella sp.]